MTSQAPSTIDAARASGEAAPLYAPPTTAGPIDLRLDANESLDPVGGLDVARLVGTLGPDALRRYPSAASLEAAIAARWGVSPTRVLVTAGGDEAIDRACRAFLRAGREIALPVPTFEMIARYARLARAEIAAVAWAQGPYPTDDVLAAVNERTAMIAVVSPNNPTGAVASAGDLVRLAREAPHSVLLVDCAYAEFADEDITRAALELPGAVVIRTFSKAFGLAGLRVGYAIGSEANVRAMRGAGSPFPVSGISLAVAQSALAIADRALPPAVSRVRDERRRLFELLAELGARPRPSQGNFVLAEFQKAEWVWRALAGLGIGVRRFAAGPASARPTSASPEIERTAPEKAGLENCLRITCPGREAEFDRLLRGLRAAVRPRALVFDLDALISGSAPVESLSTERAVLEKLAARLPLAIISRRRRGECEELLAALPIDRVFSAVVCAEDGAAPLRIALERLGVDDAWMVSGVPGDASAARSAGVVPIGIRGATARHTAALEQAGVARVLGTLDELEEMLP